MTNVNLITIAIAIIYFSIVIVAIVIPKSTYNITYQGINDIVRYGKQMYEFNVIGGPYKTNVNYYYDSNGLYFIKPNQHLHHDSDDTDDMVEVLSRDELGLQLNEMYNSLFYRNKNLVIYWNYIIIIIKNKQYKQYIYSLKESLNYKLRRKQANVAKNLCCSLNKGFFPLLSSQA